MPYKQRKRRRGSSGEFSLDHLMKQSFPEWFGLLCGHWNETNEVINSLSAMLLWYAANREQFDQLQLRPLLGMGHRPGERHSGWWFSEGLTEYGQRLVVNTEQVEQRIGRILDGFWVPSDSFWDGSDRLIAKWKAGRMPPEGELREHISLCVPSQHFQDGFESSVEFLERHQQLTDEESQILFEESM